MSSSIIAFHLGSREIHSSSIIICSGLIFCLAVFLHNYERSTGKTTAGLAAFALGFLFSVSLGRFLHWYFNPESYDSFLSSLTNDEAGNYVLSAMIIGVWAASWVVKWMGMMRSRMVLLDACAPGLAVLIVFIRASAFFNSTCRGKIIVRADVLKHFPISLAETDTAGNTNFRFCTFAVAAVLMLIVFFAVCILYSRRRRKGETWQWFVLLYTVVTVMMDSTRSDSPLMHFRLISRLNKWSAFVSLDQVLPGIFALVLLIKRSRMNIRRNGFESKQIIGYILFAVSLYGIGKLGEYNVQRFASYMTSYSIMTVSSATLLYSEYLVGKESRDEVKKL